jgi:hypothetical protein
MAVFAAMRQQAKFAQTATSNSSTRDGRKVLDRKLSHREIFAADPTAAKPSRGITVSSPSRHSAATTADHATDGSPSLQGFPANRGFVPYA